MESELDIQQSLEIDNTSISAACNGKSQKILNCFWRKANNIYNLNTNLFDIEKELRENIKYIGIFQYNKNLDFIKEWKSARKVEEDLKYNRKKCTNNCKDNKRISDNGGTNFILFENYIWSFLSFK